MIEEFINIALEAFTNSNGDIDKFELKLRRNLMGSASLQTQQVVEQIPRVSPDFEKVVDSFNINDPIFSQLENVDINSLSDEEVMQLAQRLGLMTNQQTDE